MGKKGELKNEGKSHDVIENKCRKMSISGYATMFMKTNTLYLLCHDVVENKYS